MARVSLLLALLLSGCGVGSSIEAIGTGYSKTCIDGMLYYQFPLGAVQPLGWDGKPRSCD